MRTGSAADFSDPLGNGPRPLSAGRNSLRRSVQRNLLLLVIVLAWALRLVELVRQDIWWDEARNIDVALRPFLQVAVAPELDIHPPVYFWVLHGWSRLTGVQAEMEPTQIAFLTRLLSVFFGVVSVPLLYQLTLRANATRHGAWTGVVAASIGAFSPFWLAESQETRMYTVGFALLSGAAVALVLAWQRNRRWPLVWFVLLSALALTTHYNALFILVAWYAGWAVWALYQTQRRRMLAVIMVCGLATALLVAPVVPLALRQIPEYANPNLVVPTVASYLMQNWQAYWGGYAFDPAMLNGLSPLWLWAAAALVVIGTVWVWRGSGPKTPLLLLLVWVFGGLALYYFAVMDRGAFNVRYSSFVSPALYALAGMGLVTWSRWWRPLAAVAVLVALAAWPQAIRADLFDARSAREDISGVTDWLREQVQAGDIVFVDQKYPFGFYYDRYTIDATLTPEGRELAPARYLFVDINTIDQQLQAWAADATHVYWVQWFESDTDPRRAVAFLLDQQGERVGEQNFQGYSIDWWRMTPPNTFVLAPNRKPASHIFDAAVQTVEASLPDQPVARGEHVPVALRWQRVEGGEVAKPLKARVALYSADGNRISQRDERLLNDRHVLPSEWAVADRPLNVYLLDVPDDLAPGVYAIGLLVYDADTLEPLSVVDGAGNVIGVEATIGTVEVVESKP